MRDASIAIYKRTSAEPAKPPIGERTFMFIVGVYDDVPGSVACPVVAHDPFDSEDESWPPPNKIVDPITSRIRIYHRGEMLPAKDQAAAELLEKAAVYDLRHLLDRIRDELAR